MNKQSNNDYYLRSSQSMIMFHTIKMIAKNPWLAQSGTEVEIGLNMYC